jgi:hypothetical protein
MKRNNLSTVAIGMAVAGLVASFAIVRAQIKPPTEASAMKSTPAAASAGHRISWSNI